MPVDYSKFNNIADSDEDEPAPRPSAGGSQQAPPARPAPRLSDDDPRAEIEKLKAEKRRAREAREAAEAAAGTDKPAEAEPSPEPEPAAPAEPAESEPLALLRKAEGLQEQLAAGMAREGVELKEIAAMNGLVGQLQGLLDSISIGDLEEGAERDGARARRKKLNAFVETAMPELAALRSKAAAAT